MKKLVIRRLGVLTFAQFIGVAQALWGFVIGFFSMFAGIATLLTHEDLGVFEKIFGSVAVVLFCLAAVPAIAFIFGWLYGAVLGLIANLFLETSHGIEIDVDEEKAPTRTKELHNI